MIITAVDTNVLLDLLIPNARFQATSRKALETAHAEGGLILSEVVYAELAAQFETRRQIETFLADTGIRLVPTTPEALCRAGEAWNVYRSRRQRNLTCPACGRRQQPIVCGACGRPIQVRQHILSDFLIGAHASLLADRLLTRDRGFYATYFKGLKLIA